LLGATTTIGGSQLVVSDNLKERSYRARSISVRVLDHIERPDFQVGREPRDMTGLDAIRAYALGKDSDAAASDDSGENRLV
jgi:hypothetical protein